jgi:hypothetical protein
MALNTTVIFLCAVSFFDKNIELIKLCDDVCVCSSDGEK